MTSSPSGWSRALMGKDVSRECSAPPANLHPPGGVYRAVSNGCASRASNRLGTGWHGLCVSSRCRNRREGKLAMAFDFTGDMIVIGLGLVGVLVAAVVAIGSLADQRERESMRVAAQRIGAWWVKSESARVAARTRATIPAAQARRAAAPAGSVRALRSTALQAPTKQARSA